MADVKWIKIPTDFFETDVIKDLEKSPDGDELILLYIQLLCKAYKKDRQGLFRISNLLLSDEVLSHLFKVADVGSKIEVLENCGLVERKSASIQVFKFWIDKHDRNSRQYREWRKAVFLHDGYTCQSCGTKKDLQAHHIKGWKKHKKLRYEAANGITLCRKCHLNAHGGNWKNG